MQINTVEMSKLNNNGVGTAKKAQTANFDDVLENVEEKGGAAQILAALGIGMMPQQIIQVQSQQPVQPENSAVANAVDASQNLFSEIAQLSRQGILLTGKSIGNNINATSADTSEISNQIVPEITETFSPVVTDENGILKHQGTILSQSTSSPADASAVPIPKNTDALANSEILQNNFSNQISAQQKTQDDTIVSHGGEASEIKISDAVSKGDLKSSGAQKVSADKSVDAIPTTVPKETADKSSDFSNVLTQSGSDSKQQDDIPRNSDSGSAFNVAMAAQTDKAVTKIADKVQTADKTDTARQISDAVKQAVDTGRTELRLHLSPEDLGGINIKIISQGGSISLQITADNQQTGQLLASGMNELAKSLHDNGITMSKADVSYAGFNSFDTSTSQQQQQQNFDNQSYHLPKWVPVMGNISGAVHEQPANYQSETSGISILA